MITFFHRRGRLRLNLIGALLLSTLGICSLPALALENGEMSIYPSVREGEEERSWFVTELSPGDVLNDEVTISNLSSDPLHVRLYAADATMTNDGGFSLKNFGADNTDVGAWIKLDRDVLALAPNETVAVPFTLAVPAQADVGEHLGGILIENIAPTQDTSQESININIITRVGVRTYITVPGALIYDLRLQNYEHSFVKNALTLKLTLTNMGNARVSPLGSFALYDMFDKQVDSLSDVSFGTILRDSELTKTLTFGRKHLPGWYTLQGKITYENQTPVSFSKKIFYFPLWCVPVLFFVVLIFLGLILASIKLHRFVKRARELENIINEKKDTEETDLSSTKKPKENSTPVRKHKTKKNEKN